MAKPMDLRLLWLIDDTPHWHEVSERTVQAVGGWRLVSFHTATAGLMAYRHALTQSATENISASLPEIILCDYYLDASWRGDAVCRELRQLEINAEKEHAASLPTAYIVGHSTSPTGSQRIVNAGGNCIVAKHGEQRNRSLERFLQEFPH